MSAAFPPGLYLLGSFDGAPIDAVDAQLLGLAAGSDFAARGHDPHLGDAAVDVARSELTQLIFVGRLRNPRSLAAELGCSSNPAAIATAALERWGKDVRHRLSGEWTIARWDGAARRLDIVTSHLLRDDVFLAQSGARFAVAPSLDLLARLDWIDAGLDLQGLALAYTHPSIRFAGDGRSPVRQIRAVFGGAWQTLDTTGAQLSRREPPAIMAFHGTIDDAPEAASAALITALDHAMAPHRRIGILLSGGLDSTIVAALAAQTLSAGQQLIGFTSAAPEHSDLPDESARAIELGALLGFTVQRVRPDAVASAYLPDPHHFAHRGPPRSVRHYLYDALFGAARDAGVELLLDGELGELGVTGRLRQPGLRASLRRARTGLGHLLSGAKEENAFMADLAPQLIATLPADIRSWRSTEVLGNDPAPNGVIGIPGAHRLLGHAGTWVDHFELRRCSIFHDPALSALVAGMPAASLRIDGQDRGLGRAMLKGMLPDRIRLDTPKRAFSPDYLLRAVRDAPVARSWLAEHAPTIGGDIIDLPRLDARLARIANTADMRHASIRRAQFGILAARYVAGRAPSL